MNKAERCAARVLALVVFLALCCLAGCAPQTRSQAAPPARTEERPSAALDESATAEELLRRAEARNRSLAIYQSHLQIDIQRTGAAERDTADKLLIVSESEPQVRMFFTVHSEALGESGYELLIRPVGGRIAEYSRHDESWTAAAIDQCDVLQLLSQGGLHRLLSEHGEDLTQIERLPDELEGNLPAYRLRATVPGRLLRGAVAQLLSVCTKEEFEVTSAVDDMPVVADFWLDADNCGAGQIVVDIAPLLQVAWDADPTLTAQPCAFESGRMRLQYMNVGSPPAFDFPEGLPKLPD